MENPHLDNPDMEEPTQINTNIINTKNQTDELKSRISDYKKIRL